MISSQTSDYSDSKKISFIYAIRVAEDYGMKVMIYIAMIKAVLLLTCKKINRTKGCRVVTLRFETEPEADISKEIDIICSGDSKRASLLDCVNKTCRMLMVANLAHFLNTSPSS